MEILLYQLETKDKYGKFNEFIFDSDCGSDSCILETGKVAEYWNTLAQHEMKDK